MSRVFILLLLTSPLMVACGDDDDAPADPPKAVVAFIQVKGMIEREGIT